MASSSSSTAASTTSQTSSSSTSTTTVVIQDLTLRVMMDMNVDVTEITKADIDKLLGFDVADL
ncbi:hypothetical protein HO675_07315 [Streptococcus suis]|nr:hypothetical protein [Streptococcus suis]